LTADRNDPLASTTAGGRVLIVGAGMAGVACARALSDRGADVTLTNPVATAATDALVAKGVDVQIGEPPPDHVLDKAGDVVVSPGVPPHNPLAMRALAEGHDVYSEPELAWRLREPDAPAWLAITGTNGKTTTTTMVAAILRAAGLATEAVGNIGAPLVSREMLRAGGYDALAVELSSQQLHWSSRMAPEVGAVLNLADDHLEWHGDFDAYAAAKFAIWRSATPEGGGVAIGNADDPRVEAALARVTGAKISFTLDEPKPGQFGVADGMLVDAVDPDGPTALIEADRIRPAGAHNVANALAAAAIARAYGVSAGAVRDGLAGYTPEPHRNTPVATVAGVLYVDDSKATNPHAAAASLAAYPLIVWVAGGQLKGVDVDPLVAEFAPRMRGAVVLGVDRAQIVESLSRHAPHLPVTDVGRTDDGAMNEVVRAAAGMAREGDVVLLAPAAASKDMYASYAQRGDAFAMAVEALR
jgi:UDP-N-acetylmuramoylalanine--D-glutamate ligase